MATKWYAGDGEQLTLSVKEDGSAVSSLAGATIYFVFKKEYGDTPELKLNTVGFTIVGSLATATPDTSALSGDYKAIASVTLSDGRIKTNEKFITIIQV